MSIANATNFSNILNNSTLEYVKINFIVPGQFNLSVLKNNIHYIETITVQSYNIQTNNVYPDINNSLELIVGDNPVYKRNHDSGTYDIDFPGPIFFKYQNFELIIKNNDIIGNLYDIKLIGKRFKDPNFDFDRPIIYDHDLKYFIKDKFHYRGLCGMGGVSTYMPRWHEGIYEEYSNNILNNIALDQITEYSYDDNILTLHSINEYYNSGNMLHQLMTTFSDKHTCMTGCNILHHYNIKDINSTGDNITVSYVLYNYSDIVYSLEILNHFSPLFGADIHIIINETIKPIIDGRNTNINTVYTGTMKIDNIVPIHFDKPFITIKNNYSINVTCNKQYLPYLSMLNVNIGCGYAHIKYRKMMAHEQHILEKIIN